MSRITGWSWLGQFRRMLGLCAFFHAGLHFLIFFGFDRGGERRRHRLRDRQASLPDGGDARPWCSMVPLAATSTERHDPAARRQAMEGAPPAGLSSPRSPGVLHFYMLVKADITRPVAFAACVGVLLGYRLVAHYLQLRSDATKYRCPLRRCHCRSRVREAEVLVRAN